MAALVKSPVMRSYELFFWMTTGKRLVFTFVAGVGFVARAG